MRISIPLTGTVISYNPILGDPVDPVRLIDFDLGNVSWELVSLDLENEVAEIEVTPADELDDPDTGKSRKATDTEKAAWLNNISQLTFNHTKDELYQMLGSPRLKRPFKGKK